MRGQWARGYAACRGLEGDPAEGIDRKEAGTVTSAGGGQ